MNISCECGLDGDRVWNTELAFQHLHSIGRADTKRTAERRLHELKILPPALDIELLEDELGRRINRLVLKAALHKFRIRRVLPLFAQFHQLPGGVTCLHANDARGARYWVPLLSAQGSDYDSILTALERIQGHIGKNIAIFPHGELINRLRGVQLPPEIAFSTTAYPAIAAAPALPTARRYIPAHNLRSLEADSIHVIREALAEAERPAMLYSAGKNSSVLLHLVHKAFFPGEALFPLLHIDTRWQFRDANLFRDRMAEAVGRELLVHVNPEAVAKDINPFDHGSVLYTQIAAAEGLRQILDRHRFDTVLSGERHDGEGGGMCSGFEVWNRYAVRRRSKDCVCVRPLANWTELDIWEYIHQENIPVAPLYYAEVRPVVLRGNLILLVDDERFRLLPGERIVELRVRFPALGCYPLTGAIESTATTASEVIQELLGTNPMR